MESGSFSVLFRQSILKNIMVVQQKTVWNAWDSLSLSQRELLAIVVPPRFWMPLTWLKSLSLRHLLFPKVVQDPSSLSLLNPCKWNSHLQHQGDLLLLHLCWFWSNLHPSWETHWDSCCCSDINCWYTAQWISRNNRRWGMLCRFELLLFL